MRRGDILELYGFNYWADRHLLKVASELTPEQWTAPSDITDRDLRATLVHTLDVEWSWRLRLQKRPKEEWGPSVELKPGDYPDVASLAAHWARDEREMRAWLAKLDDAALAAAWSDEREKAGFPLWYFLVHIVTHSQQQRSDAAILLTRAGHSPGNIEFLDYAHTKGA
ncbi:MAG TPA: DinB family protein [Candidatus Acidoferrales bacterium]|nr:DinB family protein [Candidatus Acidoferrales bacterium]